MKSVFSLLLSLCLVVPAFADEWSAVVKRVESALVYIETADGACTGFVVDTKRKYVQTAAHCDGKDMWVDRVSARVVAKDTKKDLMILEVKDLDPARQALKLAPKNPEIREDVMSVGYGYALERPFFRMAHVADTAVMIPEGGIGGPYIGTDAAFVGGQSGGPVVNVRGEVVAIVQRASQTVGIGVGAEIIRARVGRFWELK